MSKHCIGYNDILKKFIYVDEKGYIDYEDDTKHPQSLDEFWVSFIKQSVDKDHEIKTLKDNWNSLKEYIQSKKMNERLKLANGLEYARNTFLIPQAVLDKMTELEKGERCGKKD